MPDNRPIMVLTASAGAGHTIAGAAVGAALRALVPNEEVEIHDMLQSAGGFFRRLYGGGYLAIAQHAPAVMGWLYDGTDEPNAAKDAARVLIQDVLARSAIRHLRRRNPKLVVNTHFLPAEFVAALRRQRRLTCPQVTVTTDFDTHRLWVQEPTERYYTATEQGRAYLMTFGVPADKIIATGIPVRTGFEERIERGAAKARAGLAADVPVVLLLSGGFGVGPTERLFCELLRMPAAAQLVAVAGRNEALRRQLAACTRGERRPTKVIGFTDRLHEWMQAADVVVTKPGGLTASEALVCGLPLVIVNPIPGQETRNSDYLLEQGAAIKVNSPRLIGQRVGALLSDPQWLGRLRAAAQSIARPGAADRIARDALSILARDTGRHTVVGQAAAVSPLAP